ncbi:MAG TPA: ABC transporter ATP-binding protein/permease [Candidatus Fusicatenibacter intestinigallinarum]|uniref:ABC transporter ATP-binding protein/permease n=1 Tax=Candidatus Fusicatenibacter intestinigallinarum TaxID=2838598 RepID=A0A9D2N9I5_9FIRM|nr:ABC transporter ATP-binding protein/permease [Candidatus Fusicatenibacter intestinigallinarum]
MLKMLKYMKKSVGWILLIIVLLFVQAYSDLALPEYTSRIVDTGIQQKGIPDAVPDRIRETTLTGLTMLMDQEDASQVLDAYTDAEDGVCQLKDISDSRREELNDSMGLAMMVSMMAASEGMDLTQQVPQEQIQAILDQANAQKEQISDSIVTQMAVTFVQQEYEAMGEDLAQIQMNYLIRTGVQMLGLALISMMAAVLVTFLASRVAALLGHDLRNQVYRKVISFSSAEMNRFSTASLITRSTNDIQQVQMLMTMVFRIVLYAPIIGIGGIMKVLRTESGMTWILGVAVCALAVLILVLLVVAMPRFKKLQTMIDRLNLITREILTGLSVIRAFSAEKHEEERFEEANHRLMKTNLFVNRCMTFMMPLMMLIMNGISVLIVYVGAHHIDEGALQVGDMMAFIQYTMQIIMAFLMLSMLSVMLPRASVSANRIVEVLNTEVSIRNPEQPKRPSEDRKGEVEFSHVSFSYPGAEEEVLHDITFTAKKGETVAFIGSTGSGKSTLVNLIPRFFDVSEGVIRVDGVDIREMDIRDLRSRLGYVPQKGILFSGTIASNLRFGAEDASMEELNQAADIAQASEFIAQKEDGMESPIAQGGTNVSGGQKQRLSIARAVAKHPEIYIFDDSFSALDYKTDAALRQALKRETSEATTLIVAQRISTILHADKIMVLDNGAVAGCGTHKELMESCEVYRQIARSQLSEEELKA